jgi:hypothetical protein
VSDRQFSPEARPAAGSPGRPGPAPPSGSGFTVRRRPHRLHTSDLGGYNPKSPVDGLLFRHGCESLFVPKPSTGRDCQRHSMRGLVQTVRGCPLASTAVGGDCSSLGYWVSCEWRPLTNRELARGAKRRAGPHIPQIAGSAALGGADPIAGYSRVAGSAGALSPPRRVCWVGLGIRLPGERLTAQRVSDISCRPPRLLAAARRVRLRSRSGSPR